MPNRHSPIAVQTPMRDWTTVIQLAATIYTMIEQLQGYGFEQPAEYLQKAADEINDAWMNGGFV